MRTRVLCFTPRARILVSFFHYRYWWYAGFFSVFILIFPIGVPLFMFKKLMDAQMWPYLPWMTDEDMLAAPDQVNAIFLLPTSSFVFLVSSLTFEMSECVRSQSATLPPTPFTFAHAGWPTARGQPK